MSETLRLELAPLGVTVITGMLGHIESNVHANDPWSGLPESSRYKAVEAQMARFAEGKIGPKLEKVDDFARRFVADVLGGASGQVWRGAGALTVRALGYHAPMSVMVRVEYNGAWECSLGQSRSCAYWCHRTACFCRVVDWMSWRKQPPRNELENQRSRTL